MYERFCGQFITGGLLLVRCDTTVVRLTLATFLVTANAVDDDIASAAVNDDKASDAHADSC